MFNAIVPVTDAADQYQGVAMAKSLAETIDVSVDLITVIDERTTGRSHEELQSGAAQFLQQQAAGFSERTSIRQLVRRGDPSAVILSVIDDVPGSFLVLSPRWADTTRSFMPDSLSERLMREASVPVLLATTDEWPRSLTLENIMVPVTHTTPSASQILELSDAIGQHQTVFRLVYIASDDDPEGVKLESAPPAPNVTTEEGAGYQARWRLMELARDLRSRGVRSTWELRYGDPSQELSRAATTTGANLIVFHGETIDAYAKDSDDQIVLQVSNDAATPALLIPSRYELASLRRRQSRHSDMSMSS